jgi:deoxyribodipyrimidine photo-lyase
MEKQNNPSIALFWFRRDLRITDNTGLYRALREQKAVQPIFIFDTDILNDLQNIEDKRVSFIYEQIERLKKEFISLGSDLWVFYGKPLAIFQSLTQKYAVSAIYTNRDYEPYSQLRDNAISSLCQAHGIAFKTFKDLVIFEKSEVTKSDGKPYTVFTPYMRRWKETLIQNPILIHDSNPFLGNLNQNVKITQTPAWESMGFKKTTHGVSRPNIPTEIISNYQNTRDLMGIEGTSRLSVHLRFGTISIRQLAILALNTNDAYLNELIWREFYMQILWHFPKVVTESFKPNYDSIPWNTNQSDFERWCTAQTGYPIVDAAMNQLLQTGFMHNRARMIVASFLTKHLLIDWRKGEAFFAQHLTDYELSSNNGGWQWAASSGCDAVPYFRIFNPYTQAEKFDADGAYRKKWGNKSTISPIIEHTTARERCLWVYKKALNEIK